MLDVNRKMSAIPTNSQTSQPPKLLDQLWGKIRWLHSSERTEEADVASVTQLILFHGKRHSREMGTAEIAEYLTHLKDLPIFAHILSQVWAVS